MDLQGFENLTEWKIFLKKQGFTDFILLQLSITSKLKDWHGQGT
jgi:hypothetical protein